MGVGRFAVPESSRESVSSRLPVADAVVPRSALAGPGPASAADGVRPVWSFIAAQLAPDLAFTAVAAPESVLAGDGVRPESAFRAAQVAPGLVVVAGVAP